MIQSTTRKRFSDPLPWDSVGSHDLALRYRDPTPARLRAARDALWTFPGLEGCWRRNDREPTPAARIACTFGLDAAKPLYGLAHLPETGGVPCSAAAWVDDHGAGDDCPLCRELARHAGPPEGWVTLRLPFGWLGLAYAIGAYPVEDGTSLAWRERVDAWLCALAEHVHRSAPFDLGLVGWKDAELGPFPGAAEEAPDVRTVGYLFAGMGGLTWLPPTVGAPITEEDAWA